MSNGNTLLLVGNGLDVRNELKSSYGNYFDYIEVINDDAKSISVDYDLLKNDSGYIEDKFLNDFKEYYYPLNIWMSDYDNNDSENEFMGKVENLLKKSDFNFWMLPLIMKEDIDSNWSSIEKSIEDNLKEFEESLYNDVMDFKKSIQYNCFFKDPDTFNKFDFNFFMMISIYLYKNGMYKDGMYKDDYWMDDFKKDIKEFNLSTFLYDELYKLEKSFKKYLLHETEKNNYKENVTKDLIDLCDMEPTNILNFNYTDYSKYLEDSSVNTKNINEIVNIHGSIRKDDHIIFGIDCLAEKSNDSFKIDIPMFTKTFRIMGRNNIKINNMINGCHKIKIFGHSLDRADYSYFQSIFDMLDIYNSDVTLEFYYSMHGKKTEKELENYNKSKVFKLMSDYGNKMSNSAHGSNLLHKMLLEGRLQVKKFGN